MEVSADAMPIRACRSGFDGLFRLQTISRSCEAATAFLMVNSGPLTKRASLHVGNTAIFPMRELARDA
jgi:hypothetical protein